MQLFCTQERKTKTYAFTLCEQEDTENIFYTCQVMR